LGCMRENDEVAARPALVLMSVRTLR
jgi:hypothetical protein